MKRSNFIATLSAIFLAPFGIKAKAEDHVYFSFDRKPGTLKFVNSVGYATSSDGIVWKKSNTLPNVFDVKMSEEMDLNIFL